MHKLLVSVLFITSLLLTSCTNQPTINPSQESETVSDLISEMSSEIISEISSDSISEIYSESISNITSTQSLTASPYPTLSQSVTLPESSSKDLSSGGSSYVSSSVTVEDPLIFSDPVLEELLREIIDKPSGACYPSDFADLCDQDDSIGIFYSASDDTTTLYDSSYSGILNATAQGYPSDFSVFGQIPITAFELFYSDPINQNISLTFDLSWISSNTALKSFSYRDKEHVQGPTNRRMHLLNFGEIAKFQNLEALRIYNSTGVDLEHITSLTKLKVLRINNCDVTSIDCLESMTGITILDLTYLDIP